MKTLPFFVLVLLLLPVLRSSAQPPQSDLEGLWEGLLTQEEGGYRPEYKMRLSLKIKGDQVSGFAEVQQGNDVYIKTEVKGSVYSGFFLTLEDGLVINQKDLVDSEYCQKSYQLVFKAEGGQVFLRGKWQGTATANPCIPGKVLLKRKSTRA